MNTCNLYYGNSDTEKRCGLNFETVPSVGDFISIWNEDGSTHKILKVIALYHYHPSDKYPLLMTIFCSVVRESISVDVDKFIFDIANNGENI